MSDGCHAPWSSKIGQEKMDVTVGRTGSMFRTSPSNEVTIH